MRPRSSSRSPLPTLPPTLRFVALLAIVLASVLPTSACNGLSEGYLRVDALEPALPQTLDSLDDYVRADARFDDPDFRLHGGTREDWLRRTNILRAVLNESRKP